MKKTILTLFALIFSVALFSQSSPVIHKQDIPVFITKTIDTTKVAIIPKAEVDSLKTVADTAIAVIEAQSDTIAKQQEVIQGFKDYFYTTFWGGVNPFLYYMAFIFAFMAAFFVMLFQVYNGIESKDNGTPAEFSWRIILGWRNILKFLVAFILSVFTIYYSLYFMPFLGYTGGITMLYASIVGANWKIFAGKIIDLFKPKNKA
jgi:uncharacterized membrane protein